MWLSLSLIIEEGFSREELLKILTSASEAARNAGVEIVTGDTKVLPRGAVDGLLINTSGLGELIFPLPGPKQLEIDDSILVSGPIARHGIAVLAARESLGFDPPPESDSGILFPAMNAFREAGIPVKSARDATRGGVAAVLHEWSAACGHSIAIDEKAVPLRSDTRGACELLGLDSLHVACEGTMVLAVPAGQSAAAIEVLRSVPISAAATRIGQVIPRTLAPVLVNRALRRLVPLDEPSGAPMPRIC
jgi:hydrogenase expression/formation protein HypE